VSDARVAKEVAALIVAEIEKLTSAFLAGERGPVTEEEIMDLIVSEVIREFVSKPLAEDLATVYREIRW